MVFNFKKKNKIGIGECSYLKNFSIDNINFYEKKLHWLCKSINKDNRFLFKKLKNYPSISFGLEQAFLSIKNKSEIFFNSNFTKCKNGIIINILINNIRLSIYKLYNKIDEFISQGFKYFKFKIGILSFKKEFLILKKIRYKYPEIEIRVDANGSFFFNKNIFNKLKILNELNIHSIEQPIKVGQWKNLSILCNESTLPIALDEELIGISGLKNKKKFLKKISPKFIVLKPSLCGGLKQTKEWIIAAKINNIKWWITSSLESNFGLNIISQWTFLFKNVLPQGLSTINLYKNDLINPLIINNGKLWYNNNIRFDLKKILKKIICG